MCLKFYVMNNFRLALVFLFAYFFKIYCFSQPGDFKLNDTSSKNCVPFTEIPTDLLNNITERGRKSGNSANRKTNYTIPVVFHILHKDGPENISDEQVYNAMDIINEDFSATNSDIEGVVDTFKNEIGNPNISFQLAQQAPDGSCTNGINRYFSPYSEEWDFYWTDDGQYFLNEIKSTFYWDVDKYLNIYVVNASGNSGISFFPFQIEAKLNVDKWLDGIMIRNYNVGNTGTASNNVLTHVLSHEIGHYLDLLHTWGNWWYPGSSELDWYEDCNQDDANCPDFYCSSDDLVDDTPNCKGYNYYLCPDELINTCIDEVNDLPDNTQNVMDYSCMIMFTKGQVSRMHDALNSPLANRTNIWSEENLNYTLNCTGSVAETPCYQIYSSYIRNFNIVTPGHGYLITDANNTEIKARYKINDGDWIELPLTDIYYFTLQNIEKCATYAFQISEKCKDVFSPWSNSRFFYTNGEDIPVASKTKFYTIIEKQDETTFNANDASININAFNGIPPYTFNWSTGDTTSLLNNITPGEYYVTVNDSSGCSITDTIVIEKLYCNSLEATINYTNQNYYDTANGKIEIITSGGTLPYTYLWSTNETTNQIDNLLPGEYWFVLKDSFQCEITDTIKIDSVDCSTLNVAFNVGNETGFLLYDGFIEAEVYGGIPPYQFNWSTNDNTTSINNLTVGNYTVLITDSIGCPVTETIAVEPAYCDGLTVDVNTTTLSYKAAKDASAVAAVSGGLAPYSFSWSTGDTLQTADSLKVGSYSVKVVDSYSCTTETTFDIYEYDCNSFDVKFNTSYISYVDANDGAIQITWHNGFDPLQILWSTGDTTNQIDNLYAGDYLVEIIDSTGCAYADTLYVPNVNCNNLQLDITTTDRTFTNQNNGSISIEVENAILPYKIIWSTEDTSLDLGFNSLQLDDLDAGAYSFYFEDAAGCTAADTIVIETIVCKNFEVTIDIIEESFVGAANASISASVNNGYFPPFQYYWSTGDTTASINSLTIGDYTLTVTDAIGCQILKNISIKNSICDSLSLEIITTDLSESNANDAIATAVASGGNAPYKFKWSTDDTLTSIANLNAGTYSVEVLDSKFCSKEVFVDLYNYNCNTFKVNFNTSYLSYLNSNDGAIQITSHTGFDPLQILWSTGDTIDRINNLFEGDYSVEIIDATGCAYTDTIYVSNVNCDSLQLNITKTDQTYYNQNGGSISIEVENGIKPYNINWNSGDNEFQLNTLSPGEYSFYFEDAVGCSVIDTIVILPVICDDFEIKAQFEIESYIGANDATANVSIINGTPPFRYYWSNGETTNNIYNLEPAIYKVDVYDANGCYASDTITVDSLNCGNFNFQIETKDESYYNAQDGMATIITDNLKKPYDFYWSTGDTIPTITGLKAGVYYFLISDENECSISDSLVINTIDCSQFSVEVLIENTTCSIENNGSIQLITFKNAIEPVQFFWNKDTIQKDSLLTGLSPGFYLFDAIDNAGCGFNAAFRVGNETELNIETFVTPESWEGSNDGLIEAVVTGGTEPYKYAWSNEANTNIIDGLSGGTYTLTVTDAEGCSASVDDLIVETLTICPVSNMLTNNENLSSKTYKVINFIESNSIIETGENVIFEAGSFILLKDGFEVLKGANFSIEIEACE